MPGQTRFSDLHDDLAAAVLARLPLRHVARARLVCRSWRALTTDHRFLRDTASRRAAPAGFFLNDQFCVRADYRAFPFSFPDRIDGGSAAAEEDRPAPDLSFVPNAAADPPSGGGGAGGVHVCSSCNGLLLLVCRPSHLPSAHYVCNPLTRQLAPIPQPNGIPNLAFDPAVSPHYEVVVLGDSYAIEVYSSQTRSWRTALHPERSLFSGLRSMRGVFWNGSMLWTVGHSLLQFVLRGEYLKTIPMPAKTKEGWICAYIGESAGHLQMIGYTKKEKLTARFEILEMHGDRSEWLLLCRVDLGQVKELHPEIEWPTWNTRWGGHKVIDYLALSPVYVIRGTRDDGKDGVLIFSIPGKIMLYDMKDQGISVVREASSRYYLEHPWYHFFAYSPSLFTL